DHDSCGPHCDRRRCGRRWSGSCVRCSCVPHAARRERNESLPHENHQRSESHRHHGNRPRRGKRHHHHGNRRNRHGNPNHHHGRRRHHLLFGRCSRVPTP